jgi:hypothetical protein
VGDQRFEVEAEKLKLLIDKKVKLSFSCKQNYSATRQSKELKFNNSDDQP